jgi:hypothetical protein
MIGGSGTILAEFVQRLHHFWFIVDLVARRASAGGELATRNTLSRTPAVAGRTKLL